MLTDAEHAARNKSITDEIGRETEERFYRAMRDPWAWENRKWYLGIRQATLSEDMAGADFFVFVRADSEAGMLEVPIQIKSSKKWIPEFLRQHPKFQGEIVVVTKSMTDKEIRMATFAKLAKKYVPERRSDWRRQLFRLFPSR